MSQTSIKDNDINGSVGEFLEKVIVPNSDIRIVSAYFTIYAYEYLKSKLESIHSLRFLFGDPSFIKHIDPNKANDRSFEITDRSLSIPLSKRVVQKAIARECSEWIKKKVEIRSMVKPNFLHGKMYHITQENGTIDAITGSSNFTVNGLGLGKRKNIELNMIVDEKENQRDLGDWFDSIWNRTDGEVKDVKKDVLKYLNIIYREHDPEFIYYKTLYHIFEDYLESYETTKTLDDKTGFYDTQIWKQLYDFQKDGVKGAINKILKHNGCIIADSVGLGKTYEALAVIKYFELLNERVLVICPKKLRGNWTIYQSIQNNSLNPLVKDRFNYTVLYHTDMSREKGISDANAIELSNFNWGAYDLVVIDESHNFKGNPMDKMKKGKIKMNRAKWLMEKIVKSGVKTRVLMLSATPVNNTLRDLRNQIAFITEGNDHALLESCRIKSISYTLDNAQNKFNRWADPKITTTRDTKALLEALDPSFFKLLDELTIARSRTHIKKFYKGSSYGSFPKRKKPISVYPDIDNKRLLPSYDHINDQILKYRFSVYNPSAYVIPEKIHIYEEKAASIMKQFTQSDREKSLIHMMKVNYLKRLESSIYSFVLTLERTIQRISTLESKIKNFIILNRDSTEYSESDIIDENYNEEEYEEDSNDYEIWELWKEMKFELQDLNLNEWLKDLEKDKTALTELYDTAIEVNPERDEKLQVLKEIIKNKYDFTINKNNKKIIIFTAYSDTARYLYNNLSNWIMKELDLHTGIVTGTYTHNTLGKNDYDSILLNFSPVSKNRSQFSANTLSEEIDILIATDCISEGQNLQDCDYLVNYDIHWNPVRIIQRFGRIDRIGSKNQSIQLVNFWCTKDLDKYINLKGRVESRMALADLAATGEDNVLNVDKIEELITEDLKFRNRQLKKLQNEVLDLEEMDESISLTDFTLDDFRIELLHFLEENRKRLSDSPIGLYSIVPSPSGLHSEMIKVRSYSDNDKSIILPGVIFCLRHKEASDGNDVVNPLNPYFLVFIRDDGTVRYNYSHPKHILEIYRLLCQGVKSPYEYLCDFFNEETNHGFNMDKYSTLLKKSANEIINIFQKKRLQQLMKGRKASISMDNYVKELDDFELITWLIVL